MRAENIVGNRVSDLYCVLVLCISNGYFTLIKVHTHMLHWGTTFMLQFGKKVCIYNHSASFHSYNALFKNGIAHIG